MVKKCMKSVGLLTPSSEAMGTWSVYSATVLRLCLYHLIMVALCNRVCDFFFFSSPNLSGRRLDVYHTSTHGVALVRI